MADTTRFDADSNRSIQVENVVDGKSLNLKGDPTNNNALYTDATVSSSALPTGAATSAKQLPDGHNVTVDNTSDNPVPITEVVGTGVNGGDVSVGTTEVEMTFTGTTKSIMMQSKVANTGSIWVGLTGVTNTGSNALTQLSPGQSVSIDLNDASAAIFAISDVAAQTIYKVALT